MSRDTPELLSIPDRFFSEGHGEADFALIRFDIFDDAGDFFLTSETQQTTHFCEIIDTIKLNRFPYMRRIISVIYFFVLLILPPHTYAQTPSVVWGLLVNAPYTQQAIKTALFFAGPPNPNSLPLYTRHPLNPETLDWTSDSDIHAAINQMKTIGINVIKVSYWGHDGETDQSAPSLLFSKYDWSNRAVALPETEIINRAAHFFDLALQDAMLFAPLIEVSPSFPFYQDFPANLDPLVTRVSWLLTHFGSSTNWARVYDKDGQSRLAIWLIETIHASPIDATQFAQGFDVVAARIEQQTGYKIGFIIDPTPLPPYGATYGPTIPALSNINSILAINPFNITSQGLSGAAEKTLSIEDRIAYSQSVIQIWSASQIPFIMTLIPGYDAHLVFPQLGTYGFSTSWLQNQKDIFTSSHWKGVSFDSWNGYTEGYAVVPTVENGTDIYLWAYDVIQQVNQAFPGVPRHLFPEM